MAFPTTGILDDFNRADGSLGSNWTYVESTNNGISVSSNAARCGGPYSGYHWNVANYGPDCEVYYTISAFSSSSNFAFWIRSSGSGATLSGYYVELSGTSGSNTIDLYKVTNDSYSASLLTISGSSANLVAGNKIGVSVVGTTITIYKDTGSGWTQIGTKIDSTFTSAGKIGIELQCQSPNTGKIDDFGGGTVVVAGISGTAAVTLGALTVSAAGAVSITGTASVTLGTLTVSAGGVVPITGAAAVTLSALTTAAGGAVAIRGSLTALLDVLTASANGGVLIAGTGASSLDALTVNAAGVVAIQGSLTTTLDDLSITGAGSVAISGGAAIDLGALSIVGDGIVSVNLNGSADIALGQLILSGEILSVTVVVLGSVVGPKAESIIGGP